MGRTWLTPASVQRRRCKKSIYDVVPLVQSRNRVDVQIASFREIDHQWKKGFEKWKKKTEDLKN